ncbi:uncharacterized protein [Apostichopus japonicus]|uniref:uncharacterized protein n=1 Tax=Stichopus japonicus TaxID=307972 RepID=UPI003AB6E32E
MAASAMTPILMGRISNEKYQEKDKWRIDDIALGPANELLISGHNLEIPKTFISMYKEASGKYDNFPEFNQNFDLTQPGEQLVLFSEGSSIIGLKVESEVQFMSIEDRDVFKTLNWKRSPTCVCLYRGNLYAASILPTNVSVYNLDSMDENIISLRDMRNDCVLEMVVVMEKIYVCTKNAGRALVFSLTGSKEMELKNAIQTDAMAMSICVHERADLVFVSWSNFQIQLYSQKTSRCLRAFDMNEELHKIRVTTENRLVTLSPSKCTVTVYDVGEVIKIGESENPILSSVKEKHPNKLMSHDEWNLECHSANSETLTSSSSSWKSASKQNLGGTKEWYMQQLEENENLRRKSDREIQELNKKLEELEVRSKETGSKKKNLEFSLYKEDIEVENLQHEKKQIEKERDYLHRQQQQLGYKSFELYKRIEEIEVRCKKTGSKQKNRKYSLLQEDVQIDDMRYEQTQLQNERKGLHFQQQQLRYDSMELNKQLEELEVRSKETGRKKKNLEFCLHNEDIEVGNLQHEKKKLEKERDYLYRQQQQLRNKCIELNERINEVEGTSTELEWQQKLSKDNLDGEKEKATPEERSRVQKNESIQELKSMLTELESQQKKLEDYLVHDRRNALHELHSRILAQVELENLKRKRRRWIFDSTEEVKDNYHTKLRLRQVETENKNLQDENRQLEKEKDSLQRQHQQVINEIKEEKNINEINNQNLTKLNERIKEQEGMITELKIRQTKLEDNLKEEQKKGTREERSKIQARTSGEKLHKAYEILQKENEDLKKQLCTEKSNTERQIASFLEVRASQKELEDMNLKLQEENAHLNELLSKGKREAISQGMLPRFLSDAELDNVSCQRDTAIFGMDELESVIAESVDTGICSSSSISTSHFENLGVANGEQLNPDLKVAVTLTVKGAHMHIPDTGVELDIPAGAVRHKQLIEMTIIPFDKQFASIENFSSNSSVVVELLPNKARFSSPVHLKLPHCLQLKKNYKEIKNHVKVFVSHHEEGPPVWKEDSSAKCTLEENHCVIRLKQFCWVKFEINDKIVVAKRIKVFTAGKRLLANESIAEMEVGYYMDLPGRAENMITTLGMDFYQTKPFIFVKEGELSLQLILNKIVPKEWTYITPNELLKTISYKSIADDKDTSCPFALEKSSSSERKPYCIFKTVQGNESVELSMRF